MSARPFSMTAVIARVRDGNPGLRQVAGRADFASIRALSGYPTPAVYALLAREKAIETRTGMSLPGQQTALPQVMKVEFTLIYAVRNYRQLEGDELVDELTERIGATRNLVLGWTPPVNGGRACQLVGGHLTAYDASVALWADLFSTQHIIKPEISQ